MSSKSAIWLALGLAFVIGLWVSEIIRAVRPYQDQPSLICEFHAAKIWICVGKEQECKGEICK